MSEATDFRDDISESITDYGSSITITPKTLVEGSYGGYEPGTDTTGTSVETKALPSEFLISRNSESFGKLKGGEVIIVMAYDETIEKDYNVTWKGSSHTVNEIKEVTMDDVILGKRVKLTRSLDD